jgi:glutamate-5-semialdehyde dehydrogenase
MHVATGFGLDSIRQIVDASLDRKVCNTVNVVAVPKSARHEQAAVIAGVASAAERRGVRAIVHIRRAEASLWSDDGSPVDAVLHDDDDFLATEWEWDERPEVSLVAVTDSSETVRLFNRFSPRFVLAVVTCDRDELESVYRRAEAPFVGDGFTRWVDGQYALGRPELGLSNWQSGRLFGRGGILSGDGVFSVRYLASHRDPNQRR